jgi:polyvinyl alcohol dehydrogenase (cytochrome)
VGSAGGVVYALDAHTGCTYWTFKAAQTVRTAINVAPYSEPRPSSAQAHYAVYFGDAQSNTYAVDADTGALLWKTRVDEHPFSHITGTPTLYEGRLYVPVSTGAEEFVAAGDPNTNAAPRAAASSRWTPATASAFGRPTRFPSRSPPASIPPARNMIGPSGVSIWSAPTVDVQRKVLYVGTGNEHSGPETTASDAVLAIEMEPAKSCGPSN